MATAILKSFDSEMYPNIFPLIKVCCIIPATNVASNVHLVNVRDHHAGIRHGLNT